MSPFDLGYNDGYHRFSNANPFDVGSVHFDEYENGYKAGSTIGAVGRLI